MGLESSLVYIVARTFPESLIVILSGMILLCNNITIKNITNNEGNVNITPFNELLSIKTYIFILSINR